MVEATAPATAVPTAAQATQPPATGVPTEPAPTAGSTLPKFPWPPPQPSTWLDVPMSSLGKAAGANPTLGDVDKKLSGALVQLGYTWSYFDVPGGFAIATDLEQINPDGSPKQSDRWIAFSLGDYLANLFGAPQGYYRVFVFFVTPDLIVPSGTPVSQATAMSWVSGGGNKLPPEMNTLPYTPQYSCTGYIYEFIESGMGAKAILNMPSHIPALQHFKQSGLWQALEAQP